MSTVRWRIRTFLSDSETLLSSIEPGAVSSVGFPAPAVGAGAGKIDAGNLRLNSVGDNAPALSEIAAEAVTEQE